MPFLGLSYLEWLGSNGRLPVSLVAEHRPKVSNKVDNPEDEPTLDRENLYSSQVSNALVLICKSLWLLIHIHDQHFDELAFAVIESTSTHQS